VVPGAHDPVDRSPDRYGLINLNGSVVAPRPNWP
jgi:hypothetical protein